MFSTFYCNSIWREVRTSYVYCSRALNIAYQNANVLKLISYLRLYQGDKQGDIKTIEIIKEYIVGIAGRIAGQIE